MLVSAGQANKLIIGRLLSKQSGHSNMGETLSYLILDRELQASYMFKPAIINENHGELSPARIPSILGLANTISYCTWSSSICKNVCKR